MRNALLFWLPLHGEPNMSALRSFLLALVITFGAAASASAGNVGDDLIGLWQGRSVTGVATALTISPNGKFVLEEQHSSDARRAYLCGVLTDEGDTLVLQVHAMKERLSSGETEQMVGELTLRLPVHDRASDTLIFDFNTRTVVLNTGSPTG